MLSIRRLTAATALACTLPLIAAGAANAQDGAPVAAQSAFDAEQADAIETIVRAYLIEHPEVLLEALDALEAKRTADQSAAQKAAIAEVGQALFETPEGTVLGNPDGDVTVVEFFDYNCGYCKKAMQDMDALIAADPNVRFVLKEIPVLGPAVAGGDSGLPCLPRDRPERICRLSSRAARLARHRRRGKRHCGRAGFRRRGDCPA